MHRRRWVRPVLVLWLMASFLLMVVGAGTPATAASPPGSVPGELLVRFVSGTSDAEASGEITAGNGTEIGSIPAIGMRRVKLGAGTSVAAAIKRLQSKASVLYAEPNYIAHMTITPNDPSYPQQWALPKIQANLGWDIYPKTFTAPPVGVTIAIVDTGIDLNHPDLVGQFVAGTTFVPGTTTAQDDNGHGTHVAGTAAAKTNNGVGVAGVAYNSKLMPVKVLDSAGSGSYANVTSGITWAADHGAKVISMSLGGTAYSQPMQDAITYAYNKGVLIVVAAGNSGNSTPQYPAAMTNAMAIGASDSADAIATFSTFGTFVSVAAPGVDIYNTYWSAGSTYATLSGTSMATPHVSGLAALLFSQDPTRTNATVRSLIENSADKVGSFTYVSGRNDHFGYGRINVNRALGGTVVTPPPPPPPTTPPPPPPPPCGDSCND